MSTATTIEIDDVVEEVRSEVVGLMQTLAGLHGPYNVDGCVVVHQSGKVMTELHGLIPEHRWKNSDQYIVVYGSNSQYWGNWDENPAANGAPSPEEGLEAVIDEEIELNWGDIENEVRRFLRGAVAR